MKTIDIKGKEYVMVNERLQYFRDNFPNHSLISEIVTLDMKKDAEMVVMKASVLNENGVVVAVGHAFEVKSSSFINKTSFIENCETSAWGRALANMGIGIDVSVASAEEVANAIKNQNAPKKEFNPITEEQIHKLAELNITQQQIADWLKKTVFDVDGADAEKAIQSKTKNIATESEKIKNISKIDRA